jgi:ATP-dependent DNA helicase RecQ
MTVELVSSDLRHRYERTRDDHDVATLARDLEARFARREGADVERIAQVLALVEHSLCHANALVAHFGEKRTEPCGQCVPCRTGTAAPLPPSTPRAPLPSGVDVAAIREVRSAHPAALGAPRQLARWLSGLTSPATTRAKLTRHPLFGALEDRPFRDVLAWVETETTV